jgi:phage-related protein
MNEQTKSLLRHILTALGVVLGLVGANKVVPVISFLQDNLDGVWAAVSSLIGFVTALLAFFSGKDRFAK